MIHINLMSQQIIPNVIPVLTKADEVSKVYLVLAGKQFRSNAELLRDFYHKKGIENVDLFLCDDPNDFYTLKTKAQQLFDDIRLVNPEETIYLNATGGTKPMSLAFAMVFDDIAQNSIPIYTDSIGKRVVVLNDDERSKDLQYADVLNIKDYFYLNRFEVFDSVYDNYVNMLDREELTKEILEHARNAPSIVAELNKIAQISAFNHPDQFVSSVNCGYEPSRSLKGVLKLAQVHGLLKFRGQDIQFESIDAARYLGGGWFEELIYLAATDAGITGVGLNIKGRFITDQNNSQVNNEFDVVLIHNNQMMIVEAKTRKWGKQKISGQDTVLKLESLVNKYGGAFAKGELVTFYELPSSIKARLTTLNNVSVLNVESYEDLTNEFTKWKESTLK